MGTSGSPTKRDDAIVRLNTLPKAKLVALLHVLRGSELDSTIKRWSKDELVAEIVTCYVSEG